MANIIEGGKPHVVLISSGDRVYTDIAARFVGSEKPIDDIITSSYAPEIVRNVLNRGHLAATEFDYFIFGVEGVSRVTEIQLVRKRLASYLIKSGRVEKNGKRGFDVIKPPSIPDKLKIMVQIPSTHDGKLFDLAALNYYQLMCLLESWYEQAIALGYPEQDARFAKPQATEAKMIIGMNAHALIDWFKIRCCNKAQWEIRAMAREMLRLATEAKPDLFVNAGASCVSLRYCPENDAQCEQCKGRIPTHKQLMEKYRGVEF